MTKVVHFLLLAVIFFPFSAYAQGGDVKINGRVLDEKTQEPVIGAGVSLVGAKEGTVSDVKGNFSLSVRSLPATISIDYLGYRKQEVDIYESAEPVIIQLVESANFLNEVVVVGYGTQKRKELTGAVTSISKETLSQPVVSFDNLLGGAAAGLNITQGGQLGSTFSARIRGGNSINAGNEPLYVVDGVILYGSGSTNAGVSRVSANLNPLAAISPNDIESIQILKDVSATAIYGSRGSNGVIIISTKGGRKGKDRIEYQYSIGWQQAAKTLDLLNAQEWASLNREIGGPASALTDVEIAAFGNGYDWQNEVLRTAATQSHQASFSGGDDKTRYSLSGNFTDQDGILINTNFKRYSGRLNLERDVLKNLKLSLNLNASKLNQNGLNAYPTYAGYGSSFEAVIRTSPLNPVYDANGGYNYHNRYEKGDLVKGDVTTNAISDLANTTAQNLSDVLLGNFAALYTIIPGLELKIAAGTNITNATQNYFAPSYTAGGFTPNGYASVGHRRTDIWQYEYTLNYTKQLNKDHYLNILGGYTAQSAKSQYATATATNFANDQVLWYSLQSGNTREASSSGGSEAILNSLISRINYTLKDRYNLTATFRADGSSRFAANNKWGYFPSLGASWNINEESFLKGNRNINQLKLRASFGTVGNQEIGDYKYEALYGTTNPNDGNINQVYSFGEQLAVGYIRTNLENPDLKWEQTAACNVGIDASLFNYRLNITADAYYKKTTDLLLNTPTLSSTGLSTVLRNIGNISNKGVELEANGTIIDRRNLKWNISANIAKNINRVLELAGGQKNIGNSIWVGQPLNAHYLIVYDGIIQTEEEAKNAALPSWIKNKTSLEPGDEKFVDQNDDKVIDEAGDRVILGTATPDITCGFSTTVSYKNLSLFAAFQGVSGNKIYNSLRQTLEQPNSSNNGLATLTDRWTPANRSTTIPKAVITSATYTTSRYLEDGAFLRLKNITLSYLLPVKIATAPSAKFSVFLSGQNLLTFTKFTGFDPETGGGFGYPIAKTISLGVNLSY
ncbi:MAG: TonB-dependent receptor [Dysgonamonadaceae bacterium]|jgi:TonB-linked SusC/RagA family outer membrane protein|nr:TonB-dependent receptor [Dysgonamonadaceae bacterium]